MKLSLTFPYYACQTGTYVPIAVVRGGIGNHTIEIHPKMLETGLKVKGETWKSRFSQCLEVLTSL